jgi:hypothetical protein
MNSQKTKRLALLTLIPLIMASVLACELGGGAAKPTLTVTSPTSGTEVPVGEEVEVTSTVADSKGVTRVELAVDGELYTTDASPGEATTSWTLSQTWVASDPGSHTLTVTAYNVDDVASDPWAVTVRVVEAGGPAPEVTSTTEASPAPTDTTAPPAATGTTAPTNTPPPPTNTPLPPTNTPPPPTNTPATLPDLAVVQFSVTPPNPAWGAAVHATVGIENLGNAPSGAYKILWRWGSGDFDVCEWEKGPLPPHSGGTVQCDVPNIYASYNTVATVDWRNEVVESNEGNNSQQIAVTVGPAPSGPDLYISEIRLEPPSPQQGSPAMVGLHIHNGGTAAVPAGYRVIWNCAGPTLGCQWTGPALAPGEARWLQCEFTYSGWNPNYTTTGIVDVDNDVAESNETNNQLVLMVNVRPD